MHEPLVPPASVAEFLHKSPKTLANWRSLDIGPRFYRLEGGEVRYDWADVRAWLAGQRVDSRSA